MRKNSRWALTATILILSIATASIGRASPETKISIVPSTSTAPVDETFTIDVTVTDVTNLYGWEVEISFNNKILEVVNATEGPFLETAGYETFWPPPNLDNTEGAVTCGALFNLPFPPNGANGSGILATITFKAIGQGLTTLRLEYTSLQTVILPKSNMPIYHERVDGTFNNGAGIQLSLELIVAVVVGVAIVGTATVFYMRRKRSATP